MSRSRVKTAARMVAVAAFRETVARQDLADARQQERNARDAVEEAERGLVWLEARRLQELDAGRPDPLLLAWLDQARDVAGSAHAVRSAHLAETTTRARASTTSWVDSRRREDQFGERETRLSKASEAEDEKRLDGQRLDAWLARAGAKS